MTKWLLLIASLLFIQSVFHRAGSARAELPPFWTKHVHQGKEFYYNTQTGVTQWENPIYTSQAPLQGMNTANQSPAFVSPRSILEKKKREQRQRKAEQTTHNDSAPSTHDESEPADQVNEFSLSNTVQESSALPEAQEIAEPSEAADKEEHFDEEPEEIQHTAQSTDDLVVIDEDLEENNKNSLEKNEIAEAEAGTAPQPHPQPHPQPSSPTPSTSLESNESQISSLEQRIYDLEEKLVEALETNEQLEESVRSAQVSMEASSSLVQELRRDSNQLKQELKGMKASSKAQNQLLKKAKTAIEKLTAQVKREKGEKEELQGQLVGLTAALDEKDEENVDKAELTTELKRLEEEEEIEGNAKEGEEGEAIGESRSTLSSFFAKAFRLKGKSKLKINPKNKKARSSKSLKQEMLSIDEKEVMALRENVTALQRVVESRQSIVQELIDENNQLRNTSQQWKERGERVTQENVKLLEQVESFMMIAETKDQQLLNAEEKYSELIQRFEHINEEALTLRVQYEENSLSTAVQLEQYKQYILLLAQMVNDFSRANQEKDRQLNSLKDTLNVLVEKKKHAEEQLHNVTSQLFQEKRSQAILKIDETMPLTADSGKKCVLSFLKFW